MAGFGKSKPVLFPFSKKECLKFRIKTIDKTQQIIPHIYPVSTIEEIASAHNGKITIESTDN